MRPECRKEIILCVCKEPALNNKYSALAETISTNQQDDVDDPLPVTEFRADGWCT